MATLVLVLLASLATSLHMPYYGLDGTLPRTPPGFDMRVLGTLAVSSHNQRLPVVVFLHAMQEDNSFDRVELFQRLADNEGVTFVLPLAAKRFIESKHKHIRSWFDFKGHIRTPKNLIGYEESFQFVAEIVRSLQRIGRPIFLAGYGQGGALAMDVALSSASDINAVKGVACFSGYFITHDNFSADALFRTQLLWAHSQKDTMIPFHMAKYGYEEQLMKKLRMTHAQFLVFENKEGHAHEFNEDSVELLMRFVRGGLPVAANP